MGQQRYSPEFKDEAVRAMAGNALDGPLTRVGTMS